MPAPATTFLQFAREPVPGRVKTRMLEALSAQRACDLHCELVLWTCRQLLLAGAGEVELCVAGDGGHALFAQCRDLGAARVTRQRGADLGQRMAHALAAALQRSERVILVGSDCPAISPAYLHRAVRALDDGEVVIGPATDGGFVLLGARSLPGGIFEGVQWGTAQVYAATVANLRRSATAFVALPPLPDIDRPEDLVHWETLRELPG
ncbi:MAG: TIGR04282 family arsenosugar biosynthesis glycosyltransferase [Halioglobus sp.]|nr:TIGR04282 family arsenosugar biosynthesis glycosyltransferase [Halioglobus sp.]